MSRITPLDVNWLGHARSIAACLIESDGQTALIDPGPTSSLPTLREKLHANGLSPADLNAILLTHIHLDHAAAAGWLVRENPSLPVYVHKIGAPHMADPSRLLQSAGRLYKDQMQLMFGEFLPVPQENLRVLEGGERIPLGSHGLEVLYTPGHASHHVSYFDSSEGVAFVGDTTGMRIENDSFVLPVTPPPDIDLEVWETSLAAISSRRPTRLFLTHFGFSPDPSAHIFQFRERLHLWAARVRELVQNGDENAALGAFTEFVRADLARHLRAGEAAHYLFNGGLELSWLGLARYWRKRAATA
jgi:glyoxylase-like metal-dependent hydrolase (beta-lactamase superfamily II)